MNDEISRYKPPADFSQRNKRNTERLTNNPELDLRPAGKNRTRISRYSGK